MGCLYIEPAWTPNAEPQVLEPDLAPGEEFVADLNFLRVLQVVGNDEDSEQISCAWIVPNEPYPDASCDRDGSLIYSVLILGDDPEFLASLDDQLITAHIVDPLSDADVQVRFRASFDGGAP